MKIVSVLIFSMAVLYGCSNERPPIHELSISAKDSMDIKVVIAAETIAFANRDSIQLFNYYAKDEVVQSAWNNVSGSYSTLMGFNAIRENFRKVFSIRPNKVNVPEIKRTNWLFRKLSYEWVWVNYHQELVTTDGKIYKGYEIRLMKWEHGEWRIAVNVALVEYPSK